MGTTTLSGRHRSASLERRPDRTVVLDKMHVKSYNSTQIFGIFLHDNGVAG